MAESVAEAIVIAADLDALSRAAAGRIAAFVAETIAARGRCTVALSGGGTPRPVYQLLAGEYRRLAPWGLVEWFWGDERCVPPDHPESNYRAARELLLAPLRVSPGMTHRIECTDNPGEAAAAYDALLHERLTDSHFDLILLGVGPDGHTASLFPGSPALDETARWAVPVTAGPALPVRERVTLTLPVLNRAHLVIMLISGADKRPVVERLLAGDRTLPAGRVHPDGHLIWYVDQAARGAA